MNIDELKENGDTLDFEYQEQESQAKFLDSRSAFSDQIPKSILKKQSGISSQLASLAQEESKLSRSLAKSKGGYSAISNIKQRIQRAIDDSKSGASRIRGEVATDLVTIEELEKKPLEPLGVQKYEGRDSDDYEGQTHLMAPVSALDMGVKPPRRTKYNDSDLLQSIASIKVSSKLQLPKIQIKSKKELGGQARLADSQDESEFREYKTEVQKTKFEDSELLKAVKESIPPQEQPIERPPSIVQTSQEDRATSSSAKEEKKQVQIKEEPAAPAKSQTPQQQKFLRQVQASTALSKPLVKFLSTAQQARLPQQPVTADQFPPEYAFDTRDRELENLEKEIQEHQRAQQGSAAQAREEPGSVVRSWSQTHLAESQALRHKQLQTQKNLLIHVQQSQSIVANFMTLFTSEAAQAFQREKTQLEQLRKRAEDHPVFENPRESIKSFTESLALQKTTLSDLLRRQSLKADLATSLPRIRSMAHMVQR